MTSEKFLTHTGGRNGGRKEEGGRKRGARNGGREEERVSSSTFCICCASSLVGASTSAWQFSFEISICSKIAMAKVAVLPVPDCAWAITSYPVWVCVGVWRWDDEKIQRTSVVMSYTDL